MRPVLLSILVLLAACSAPPAADSTTTTVAGGEAPADATADTTADAPEGPSSTVAPSTVTSSTVAPPVPGSPVDALDSFEWVFTTVISAGDADVLSIRSSGTYVDGDFICELATGLPGSEISSTFLSVDDSVYAETGDGFVPVVDEDEASNALAICPGSNVFWEDIAGGGPLPEDGERETVNQQETVRIDLTGRVDDASGLGLFASPSEGVTFDRLVFWLTDAGWITALEISGALEPEGLADMTGSEADLDGRLDLRVDVTSPDDPDLVVPSP